MRKAHAAAAVVGCLVVALGAAEALATVTEDWICPEEIDEITFGDGVISIPYFNGPVPGGGTGGAGQPIPEPASLTLLAAGLTALLARRRRGA